MVLAMSPCRAYCIRGIQVCQVGMLDDRHRRPRCFLICEVNMRMGRYDDARDELN